MTQNSHTNHKPHNSSNTHKVRMDKAHRNNLHDIYDHNSCNHVKNREDHTRAEMQNIDRESPRTQYRSHAYDALTKTCAGPTHPFQHNSLRCSNLVMTPQVVLSVACDAKESNPVQTTKQLCHTTATPVQQKSFETNALEDSTNPFPRHHV